MRVAKRELDVGKAALSRVTRFKRLECQKCDMNVSQKRVQQLLSPGTDAMGRAGVVILRALL
jgi:hypothetical protein